MQAPNGADIRLECRDSPDLFHPGKGESSKWAKAICHRCPIEVKCLEEALTQRGSVGVQGGLTDRERRHIKKMRKV